MLREHGISKRKYNIRTVLYMQFVCEEASFQDYMKLVLDRSRETSVLAEHKTAYLNLNGFSKLKPKVVYYSVDYIF